ncbi:MAG: ABC transporter permease [Lentisphaerota bacterium]
MKPYQALIWNEWRRIRGMFLAAAGATILLWLTLFILSALHIRDIDLAADAISLMLPLMLSGIGYGAFQNELKSQTDSFLLSLPISRGKIFWCKYLFNFSLYIVLLALCRLLFHQLISSGNSATEFSIMFCLALHAIGVTAPLMDNRRFNKILAGTVVLAIMALLIGVQAIVALYTYNELRCIAITAFIMNLILWFSALGMGYYLWTSYIAFKRNVMRPLLVVSGILIIISAILFTTAYIYSGVDLAEAKCEARASGLNLEIIKPATPMAESKNSASRILNSLSQYQARLNIVRPKLPSQSNNDNRYSWLSGTINPQLPSETMRQAADFILNDPAAANLYADLLQTLSKFDGLYLQNAVSGTRLRAIEVIRNFLNDRAYALELNGRTPETFECLELLDKLVDSLNTRRDSFYMDWADQIRFSKFNIAVDIGPDTLAEVKHYEKLLQELASMRPEFYDDTSELLKLLVNDTFGTSQGLLIYFRKIAPFLLSPYNRESVAGALRWQVAYKQLFERAVTEKFTELKADMQNRAKQYFRFPTFVSSLKSPFKIQECYRQRTRIASLELCLALKIYKAKHGHFPDSLAKLAPEILPVIPLNPVNGENFGYRAVADRFSLEIKSIDLFWSTSMLVPNGSSIKINVTGSGISACSYDAWDKNPDPAVLAAAKAEEPSLPQNKRRRAPAPVLTNTKEKTK